MELQAIAVNQILGAASGVVIVIQQQQLVGPGRIKSGILGSQVAILCIKMHGLGNRCSPFGGGHSADNRDTNTITSVQKDFLVPELSRVRLPDITIRPGKSKPISMCPL